MDFANPAYLLTLPLALAPLILHLFFHRRRSTVLFSSLAFLVRHEKYFAYRRRIQEVLIMLCRMAAIALCILALAHPYFKRISFLSGARTEAVIVLDDTMSMQRTTSGEQSAFQLALHQAENLMNALNKEDAAGLVFLSGRAGVESTKDKQRLVEALRGASVTGTAGNLTLAIAQAVDMLKHSPSINREIYLLTDMQENMLPNRKIDLSGLDNGRLFVLPLYGASDNAAVACTFQDLSLKTPGNSVYMPFTIRNTSQQDRSFKVELNITGASVQSQVLLVKGNSSASGSFVYVPERAGRVDGTISIDDANIPLDNAAPFSFTVSDVLKVLLLSEPGALPSPFYYLKMAVEPKKRLHGIEFTEGTLDTLGALDLKQFPLIFLEARSRLTPEVLQQLQKYVRDGGNLVAVANAESGLAYMNGMSEAQFQNGFKDMDASGMQFKQGLASINENLQLDLLKWRRLAPLPGAGNTLAQCGSTPAIVEQPLGEGRLVLLAFDLRRRCSNWTELKSFPIAMNSLVNYASGRKDRTTYINCGEALKLSEDKVSYTGSTGMPGTVEGSIFKETWLPGTVIFSAGNLESAVLSPPERESELKVLPIDAMQNAFSAPVSLLSTDEEPALQIMRLRRGTDLSGYSLLAALALLVVEYILGLQFNGRSKVTKQGGR
ncbi:MAG: BatA and WFA domain-containing protein [Victivallales bacterium]|nr:BatA and WFA domain-containing protein [Victivallales bacterium]